MYHLKRFGFFMGLYIGIFALFTAVFLGLFRSPLYVSQHVLFYRGMMLLGVTAACIGFLLMLFSMTAWRTYMQTCVAALIISIAIHLTAFVVLPVTFERSVTMDLLVFLAGKGGSTCGGATKDEMQQELINGYVLSHDAVGKRMQEQQVINMVEDTGSCYAVTKRANTFLDFSRLIKRIYNMK